MQDQETISFESDFLLPITLLPWLLNSKQSTCQTGAIVVQICHPPGFSVHEILQARILEWAVVIAHLLSCAGLFVTP